MPLIGHIWPKVRITGNINYQQLVYFSAILYFWVLVVKLMINGQRVLP